MRILKYDIEKVTGIPWKKKKSYRYLYRLACREDVIKKAFKRMRKGKTKRKDFQMAEEKKRQMRMPKLLRTAAMAAALACALAVTAGAVNMATDGLLFRTLREVWSDGYETRYEAVDEAGNVIDITATAGASITTEDGRMILHAVNEDIDITGEIAETGAYHQEWIMKQRTVTVNVTGTQEEWTLVEEVTDQTGDIYRFTVTSDDMATGVQTGTAVIGESIDEDGVENVTTVTVTENGVENITAVRP